MIQFTGRFTRISPAQFAERSALPVGWFVVNYSYVDNKKTRRAVHGEWFKIKSDKGSIYRILRFSPRLKLSKQAEAAEMVLDWIGWIDLYGREEDVNGPIELTATRLAWWQRPWAYLSHPDPAVRLSGYLGWASVILGALSLALTIPWKAILQH